MKGRYTIGVLAAVFLWGISFIWTKETLNYLTPLTLVTFRVLIATVLVMAFAHFTGRLQKLDRRDIVFFFILAAFEPTGYFIFETNAMLHVTPSLAGVVLALIPILSPILAFYVNGERAGKNVWAGLLVSLCGVLMVILADGFEDLKGRLVGVLLLTGSVAMAMVYTIGIQRLSKRFNSFTIVAWQNVFSAIMLIPILLIFDYEPLQTLQFSWHWFSRLLALGALCSSVAFILYADGIRELGVARTSTFNNLTPAVATVASFLILGETMEFLKILGIIITISGLYIGGRR